MANDGPKTVEEEIDHALEESFPASDPPSWSNGKRHDSSLPPRERPAEVEDDSEDADPN